MRKPSWSWPEADQHTGVLTRHMVQPAVRTLDHPGFTARNQVTSKARQSPSGVISEALAIRLRPGRYQRRSLTSHARVHHCADEGADHTMDSNRITPDPIDSSAARPRRRITGRVISVSPIRFNVLIVSCEFFSLC